jgi:hypothetical protein
MFSIGSGKNNDIIVAGVAAHHARVHIDAETKTVWIEDVSKGLGIFYEGLRLQSMEVVENDIVYLGKVALDLSSCFVWRDGLPLHCMSQDRHVESSEPMANPIAISFEQNRPSSEADNSNTPPLPTPSAAVDKIKKILLIFANPKATALLELDKEYQLTQEQMQAGKQRDLYIFLPAVFAANFDRVMRALTKEPQIVHFSGHGGGNGIYLLDANGFAQSLNENLLKALFEPLKGICECVLLNACYSAQQAALISTLGIYVIGYNLPVADDSAYAFSKGFYLGLSEGDNYLAAIKKGRIQMMSLDNDSHLLLELWKDGQKINL